MEEMKRLKEENERLKGMQEEVSLRKDFIGL
jgi:hypothetical protein